MGPLNMTSGYVKITTYADLWCGYVNSKLELVQKN